MTTPQPLTKSKWCDCEICMSDEEYAEFLKTGGIR